MNTQTRKHKYLIHLLQPLEIIGFEPTTSILPTSNVYGFPAYFPKHWRPERPERPAHTSEQTVEKIYFSIKVFSRSDTDQIPNRCYVCTSIHLHANL